jgi:hypothetical protein
MVMSLKGINDTLDELLKAIVFVGGVEALNELDPRVARDGYSHLYLFMARAEGFMRVLSLDRDDVKKRFHNLADSSTPDWRFIFDMDDKT